MFSPNGLFSNFFNTVLRPYVDTSTAAWRIRPVDGVTPPVSSSALSAFEQAAKFAIRSSPKAAQRPALRFYVTPEALDSQREASDSATWRHENPIRARRPTTTQIVWPGPSGMVNAQVSI